MIFIFRRCSSICQQQEMFGKVINGTRCSHKLELEFFTFLDYYYHFIFLPPLSINIKQSVVVVSPSHVSCCIELYISRGSRRRKQTKKLLQFSLQLADLLWKWWWWWCWCVEIYPMLRFQCTALNPFHFENDPKLVVVCNQTKSQSSITKKLFSTRESQIFKFLAILRRCCCMKTYPLERKRTFFLIQRFWIAFQKKR